MVPRRLLSEISCGRAFRPWPIAFGTKKSFRQASSFISTRRPNHWPSKMTWNACRPAMMRSVPCNLAPGLHGRRADPAAVVHSDRGLDLGAILGDSGFLARRYLRQLHLVRSNPPDRHGLAVCMRAFVCWSDFSDSGIGQSIQGAHGDFKCDAAERAFALNSCLFN